MEGLGIVELAAQVCHRAFEVTNVQVHQGGCDGGDDASVVVGEDQDFAAETMDAFDGRDVVIFENLTGGRESSMTYQQSVHG